MRWRMWRYLEIVCHDIACWFENWSDACEERVRKHLRKGKDDARTTDRN